MTCWKLRGMVVGDWRVVIGNCVMCEGIIPYLFLIPAKIDLSILFELHDHQVLATFRGCNDENLV
jgi:hypothetical protein